MGKSDFQRVVGRIERRLLGEVLDHVLEGEKGEVSNKRGSQERDEGDEGHTLRPLGLAPAMVFTVAPDL